MDKRLQLDVRKIWLIANFILCLSIFIVPENSRFFRDFTLSALILSFPSNLLIVPILMNIFRPTIGAVYLITYLCWIIAYVQWSILVPILVRFIRRKFGLRDYQINLFACVEAAYQLSEAKNINLNRNWYDERKRTPVERVFENEED